MKAYLKKDPTRLGKIAYVYTTDYGQKRLTVFFGRDEEDNAATSTIDADANEVELVPEDNEQ